MKKPQFQATMVLMVSPLVSFLLSNNWILSPFRVHTPLWKEIGHVLSHLPSRLRWKTLCKITRTGSDGAGVRTHVNSKSIFTSYCANFPFCARAAISLCTAVLCSIQGPYKVNFQPSRVSLVVFIVFYQPDLRTLR